MKVHEKRPIASGAEGSRAPTDKENGHEPVRELLRFQASPQTRVGLLVALVSGCSPHFGGTGATRSLVSQQSGTAAWDIPTDRVGTDAVGQIKGYASATSVYKGEDITFFVSVNPSQTFTVDVYRIGWYQGRGGRLMQHIGPLNGVKQPNCPTDATTGVIECHWSQAFTLATQNSWPAESTWRSSRTRSLSERHHVCRPR